MADRFPLIVDASSQQLKELPASDNIDLTSSGIVKATSIGSTSISATSSININSGSTPTSLYVNGNASSNIVAVGSVSSNTTLDFSAGNNFSLTLGGSFELSNPSGLQVGQSGIILLLQDSSGSRVLSYGSSWDFPASTAPTLTTTAAALDVLTYFVRSSTSIVTNSILNIGAL